MPEPKVKPTEVAIETLDALETGLEEVFPGEPSKGALAGFRADPVSLQAQFAKLVGHF